MGRDVEQKHPLPPRQGLAGSTTSAIGSRKHRQVKSHANVQDTLYMPASTLTFVGSYWFLQAQAERYLIAAALQEPRNLHFVLLSERCLPVYPPQVRETRSCEQRAYALTSCSCGWGDAVVGHAARSAFICLCIWDCKCQIGHKRFLLRWAAQWGSMARR